VEDAEAQKDGVTLNGNKLTQLSSREAFDATDSGWFNAGNNLVLAKTGSMPVADRKVFAVKLQPDKGADVTFDCKNGNTVPGQSVYVLGSIAELGSWNSCDAFKLDPNGTYPTWTGTKRLPPSTAIEWKCIKRLENVCTVSAWEPGPNNSFTTPASGTASSSGDFQQ